MQINLFNEAEDSVKPKIEEPIRETITFFSARKSNPLKDKYDKICRLSRRLLALRKR
jgi:hypothetical protein